jgi:hypothetical protein
VIAAGIDSGVKGSWSFTRDDGSHEHETWDLSYLGKDDNDAVRRAIARAQHLCRTKLVGLISRVDPKRDQFIIPVGIDLPLFMPAAGSGYSYGPQCAMTAIVIAHLQNAGVKVVPLHGATARRMVDCKGRGKPGMITWSQNRLPAGALVGLRTWEVETVCEAFLMGQAARQVQPEGAAIA